MSRGPGRPRAFDEDAALDAAIQVFWQAGYPAASLDALTCAMGIARPSLYAAFGDKEALYARCLGRYRDHVCAFVQEALMQANDFEGGLAAMFDQAILAYTKPMPRGCLLASAALGDAPVHSDARATVAQCLDALEAVIAEFCERFASTRWDARAQARLVVTFLYGISARARLGVPAKDLRQDVKHFTQVVVRKP